MTLSLSVALAFAALTLVSSLVAWLALALRRSDAHAERQRRQELSFRQAIGTELLHVQGLLAGAKAPAAMSEPRRAQPSDSGWS